MCVLLLVVCRLTDWLVGLLACPTLMIFLSLFVPGFLAGDIFFHPGPKPGGQLASQASKQHKHRMKVGGFSQNVYAKVFFFSFCRK